MNLAIYLERLIFDLRLLALYKYLIDIDIDILGLCAEERYFTIIC